MGNISFSAQSLPKDTIVRIIDTKFTKHNEFESEVSYVGKVAKVINSGNMFKSRPNAPEISLTECVVVVDDKAKIYRRDVLFTNSLVRR